MLRNKKFNAVDAVSFVEKNKALQKLAPNLL